jgi:ubiquinone/menaquinone biosynthesis C-methylase UbiE
MREYYATDPYDLRKVSGKKRALKLEIRALRNKKALAQLNKHAPIHDGTRVLDVGCGDGEFLNLLPTKHKYGVDINQNSVKRARRKGIDAGWGI